MTQIRGFLAFCGDAGPTRWDMQSFVDQRAVLHPASADQAVSALQCLGGVLGWEEAVARLVRPRHRAPPPQPLSPAQLGRVLGATEGWLEDVVVRLLLEGELTLVAVRGLRVEHVVDHHLVVPGLEEAAPRRLSPRLAVGLRALCLGASARSHVVRGSRGRPLSVRGLSTLVARVGGRAGVPRLTPCRLRQAAFGVPSRRAAA